MTEQTDTLKTQARKADEMEFALKKVGFKYYDKVAMAVFYQQAITIDAEDLAEFTNLTNQELTHYINHGIASIFHVVHGVCNESHKLVWRYIDLEGSITTGNHSQNLQEKNTNSKGVSFKWA